MEVCRALLEELDDRRVEADGDGARNLDDEARPRCRPAPRLAGTVAMPRAVHPEMRPELQAIVEADEEILALRLDCRDRRADDPANLRPGLACAGGADDAPDEMWPEASRRSEEGIALRHRAGPQRDRSASPR